MQNFGLEDLSHVQSRRNLLKYLVRVEMASDWFTRIYRSRTNFLQDRDMACKLGCGLFLSPQLCSRQKANETATPLDHISEIPLTDWFAYCRPSRDPCVFYSNTPGLTVYKVLDFYFFALHDVAKPVVSQLQITTGLTWFRHDDEIFLFIH